MKDRQGLEGLPEDREWRGMEPILEDGSIDLAEVDLEGKVLLLLKLEGGGGAEDTGLDLISEEEERGGGAVVGAAAAIFSGSAAELGEDEGKDLILEAKRVKIFLECGDGLRELFEEGGVEVELSGMGIVTGVCGKVDAGGETGCDHSGDLLEVAGEWGMGVVGCGPVAAKELEDTVLGDEGVHGGMLKEAVGLVEGVGLGE